MADGAVIGHFLQPLQQLEMRRTLALRVVQQRFDQGADREILVAWMVEHAARRVIDAAIHLALAATDAVRNLARELFELTVLQNAGFQFQQVERRREDVIESSKILKFAGIHQPAGSTSRR